MVPCGEDVDGNSSGDEGGTEPKGEPEARSGGALPGELQFLKEEAESGDDESEAHQRKAGADPREEGALSSQEITL